MNSSISRRVIAGREQLLAPDDRADAAHELFAGGVLEQEAAGTGEQGVVDELGAVERRQHDHPDRVQRAGDPTGRLDPVETRHPDVHQHDVGADRVREVDGGGTVGGLAEDEQVGLGGEDHPEPGAHQLLVVCQHDGGHGRPPSGSRRPTAKPPSVRGPQPRVPPAAATVLASPFQPGARARDHGSIAAAAVEDLDPQRVPASGHRHLGRGAGGVPGDVDDRLPDHAEGEQGGRAGRRRLRLGDSHVDADPAADGGQPRRLQRPVRGLDRVQAVAELGHAPGRRRGDGLRAWRRRSRGCGAGRPPARRRRSSRGPPCRGARWRAPVAPEPWPAGWPSPGRAPARPTRSAVRRTRSSQPAPSRPRTTAADRPHQHDPAGVPVDSVVGQSGHLLQEHGGAGGEQPADHPPPAAAPGPDGVEDDDEERHPGDRGRDRGQPRAHQHRRQQGTPRARRTGDRGGRRAAPRPAPTPGRWPRAGPRESGCTTVSIASATARAPARARSSGDGRGAARGRRRRAGVGDGSGGRQRPEGRAQLVEDAAGLGLEDLERVRVEGALRALGADGDRRDALGEPGMDLLLDPVLLLQPAAATSTRCCSSSSAASRSQASYLAGAEPDGSPGAGGAADDHGEEDRVVQPVVGAVVPLVHQHQDGHRHHHRRDRRDARQPGTGGVPGDHGHQQHERAVEVPRPAQSARRAAGAGSPTTTSAAAGVRGTGLSVGTRHVSAHHSAEGRGRACRRVRLGP